MSDKVCATVEVRQRRAILAGVIVFSVSLFHLARGMREGPGGEPHFVDESAFVSQAYFLDLWLSGRWHHAAWVEYPAYDLPPLPKYLFGTALRVGGQPFPKRGEALRWYRDISLRLATPEQLAAARWASVVCGALGCVAVFTLCAQAGEFRLGLVAAGLLLANPLYALHARRAMADVPAEALILATTTVGLWGWRTWLAGNTNAAAVPAAPDRGRDGRRHTRTWLAFGAAGVLGGLAVLAKLNGGLGLMTLAAWSVLALVLPGASWRSKARIVAATAGAGLVAYATFVAFNPFLLAQPKHVPADLGRSVLERTAAVVRHRAEVSTRARDQFPHDALTAPAEKLRFVAVQGFGRFGPLGPRRHSSTIPLPRVDWGRDWGAWLWGPCALLGAVTLVVHGRNQRRAGGPPTAWALLVQAALAVVTVTAFVPLAWDRYLLSIQPGAAILGGAGLLAAWDLVVGRKRS